MLNCESADEDILYKKTIEFTLGLLTDKKISRIRYKVKFEKKQSSFSWFLFSIFCLVLFLIFVLLLLTCNNVRRVKKAKEEYRSSFRKYIRGVRSGNCDKTFLIKRGLVEYEDEDDDDFRDNYGFLGSSRNRVQYSST